MSFSESKFWFMLILFILIGNTGDSHLGWKLGLLFQLLNFSTGNDTDNSLVSGYYLLISLRVLSYQKLCMVKNEKKMMKYLEGTNVTRSHCLKMNLLKLQLLTRLYVLPDDRKMVRNVKTFEISMMILMMIFCSLHTFISNHFTVVNSNCISIFQDSQLSIKSIFHTKIRQKVCLQWQLYTEWAYDAKEDNFSKHNFRLLQRRS